ncbi:MAG TPA: ribosome-associated translation inhibitor RaiA [Actinomycetota bacterium]
MQVIVKGRHTNIPHNIKELATQKLEKVQRLFDRIQKLEIEFTEEHNPRIADKHIVEVILTTKAHVLRAHAAGPDPLSAVDRVTDKLTRQVRSMKGKMVGRNRPGTSKEAVAPVPFQGGSPAEAAQGPYSENGSLLPIESPDGLETGEAGDSRITRVKRFAIKPMTAQEAVLQMESLGHDFFLFVNAESEQAGVVYRRNDGSFGLIEPS